MEHRNLRPKFAAFFRGLLSALTISFCALSFAPAAYADDAPAAPCTEVAVGSVLENATIQDANKQPAQIPGLGERILLILYTDPDVANQNDPFADQVKAQNFDQTYFQSIGIANMEDAPAKPNWAIRMIIRGKIKKYQVTILTDPKRGLIKQWKLCDCNDKSVVLLIGKDKKLKYFKKGALSADETQAVIAQMKQLIADAKGQG